MDKPLIKIYDIETDTTSEREMTDAEFKAWDDGNKDKAAKDAAEAQAKAELLERLGITADEAKLLLA